MAYENNEKKLENVYSKRIKAGKKRTYFFDIKETRNNAYSLIITESRRRFDDRGYDRSSVFVYPEDVNKFAKGLAEAVDFIKTELLPNYNFEEFDNEYEEGTEPVETEVTTTPVAEEVVAKVEAPKEEFIAPSSNIEEVDKW